MPLFTFNFKNIYVKILLAIFIGMGSALALVKGIVYMNDASSETILGRVLQAKKALPKIVKEEKDIFMFYGSSMAQAGFSPRQFDQEMSAKGIDIKSFNFGFGGLNPFFQDILSRRIREAFVSNNRRLNTVVIEFNPFQTTITRRNRALALEDSFITMLGTEKEMRDITFQDPTRGIRLYNIRYLRGYISAEMISSYFSRGFRAPRNETKLTRDKDAEKRLQDLGGLISAAFDKEYPNYVPSQWSYEWQGGGTIPEERSTETLTLIENFYQAQQLDFLLDDDRLSRIHSADIIELNFSDQLLLAFIGLVKNFQTISDRVEIVLLPRNTDWVENSPEGKVRLMNAISEIEDATGITIQNHQDLSVIKPSMFSDTTHLNRYRGAVAYTHYLAEFISGR